VSSTKNCSLTYSKNIT